MPPNWLRFSYDVQECLRNLLRITHGFSNRGIRGRSFEQFKNFWAEFLIDLRIARTGYRLCESVKIFTNWVRYRQESKYLSIRGNSWDSGPAWNRGIREKFNFEFPSSIYVIYTVYSRYLEFQGSGQNMSSYQ